MIEVNGKVNSGIIYSDDLESNVITQLKDILSKNITKNEVIRVMPDCHLGKGCMIGYTQTYTELNPIDPDVIGCDIGCGVRMDKIRLPNDLIKNLELINHRIRETVPLGDSTHDKVSFEEKSFRKFLKNKLERTRSMWPSLVNYSGLGEIDKYIESTLKRLNMSPTTFWKSIGTLGGGNHFIEVGKDEDELDVIYLTVHTGSRNLGIKVLSYWKKIISSSRSSPELNSEKKLKISQIKEKFKHNRERINKEVELINKLYKIPPSEYLEREEDIKGYLSDMYFAQAYAEYNREIICANIRSALKGNLLDTIESIHNYIDPRDKVIRKGAISAKLGEKLLIPINMAYGVIIGSGLGNEDWNNSAPHGAGRKLSRGKAKENLSMEDFKESMENIFSTSVTTSQLDEAPGAYKDPESIVNLINGICIEIIKVVKPILSIKA